MSRVLVTGASGFVGSALIKSLISRGQNVIAVSRETRVSTKHLKQIQIQDICECLDWSKQLQDVDVIVHTAARVHSMAENKGNSLSDYRRVNTLATLQLASQAAKEGVKRFIFLSTIKVNGELSPVHKPFTEQEPCNPADPYGISKWEAEQGLIKLSQETGIEVVIIRIPLVYGPGVKGNFASMIKWVEKGIPLPFAAVKNRRSLLALDNLVSFIITCIGHPKAANEIFLLADDEGLSMPELVQKLATSQGKAARLFFLPVSWMKFVAKLVGKSDITDRLFGSLQLDSRKARELLQWTPIVTMDEQLDKIRNSN